MRSRTPLREASSFRIVLRGQLLAEVELFGDWIIGSLRVDDSEASPEWNVEAFSRDDELDDVRAGGETVGMQVVVSHIGDTPRDESVRATEFYGHIYSVFFSVGR